MAVTSPFRCLALRVLPWLLPLCRSIHLCLTCFLVGQFAETTPPLPGGRRAWGTGIRIRGSEVSLGMGMNVISHDFQPCSMLCRRRASAYQQLLDRQQRHRQLAMLTADMTLQKELMVRLDVWTRLMLGLPCILVLRCRSRFLSENTTVELHYGPCIGRLPICCIFFL